MSDPELFRSVTPKPIRELQLKLMVRPAGVLALCAEAHVAAGQLTLFRKTRACDSMPEAITAGLDAIQSLLYALLNQPTHVPVQHFRLRTTVLEREASLQIEVRTEIPPGRDIRAPTLPDLLATLATLPRWCWSHDMLRSADIEAQGQVLAQFGRFRMF